MCETVRAMAATSPALDITKYWVPLNEQLISLVDLIPDEQMDWSPKPELHNFRGILIHISNARDNWLGYTVQDGETPPDVLREGQTREGLKEQLRRSWARMERFLSDERKLANRTRTTIRRERSGRLAVTGSHTTCSSTTSIIERTSSTTWPRSASSTGRSRRRDRAIPAARYYAALGAAQRAAHRPARPDPGRQAGLESEAGALQLQGHPDPHRVSATLLDVEGRARTGRRRRTYCAKARRGTG